MDGSHKERENIKLKKKQQKTATMTRGRASIFKMRAAYAHLTKKCVRAAKICVSVNYRSNYHLGQKPEQQQQIQARVQTYSLNQSFSVIAAFVELDSSNY